MNFQQRLRRGWLTLLKHTLNPFTRRLARSSIGPFSLVQHVGRRSGKPYETPIIASQVADGFIVELTYGPNVDWYKNVVAAGGCTLVWHGRPYKIKQIETVDTGTGLAAFPWLPRSVLRLLRRTHFEKMKVQE